MKRLIRKLHRVKKSARFTFYFLVLTYLISYIFFSYNLLSLTGVETALRIIIIIFFFLWFVFYLLFNLVKLVLKKYKGFIISSIFTFLFIVLFVIASYYMFILSGGIRNMQDENKTIYTSYLIKLQDTEFNKESVIGRISNEDDYEGYVLTKKIISKHKITNEIEDFDDYLDMAYALYDNKIDAIFVPSNYISLFRNEEALANVEYDTKVIYKHSEKNTNQDKIVTSDKDFEEPLTFLIMGVDSTIDGLDANAGFNGDTLMLVTFNPKTFDILIVSVPRDTYVPIKCNHDKHSKINSAAAYGTKCVIDTVGSFLDVDIDYYVKINFKGVVSLIDALGGIEVDVEAPTYMAKKYNGKMCEQNSDRQFGSKLVCVDPGWQKLNGEEALAYARNRHMYIGSDIDRIRHQQQIFEAVGNKMLSFSTISEFQKVFDAISKNIATNMDKEKILSGYSVIKDLAKNALNDEDLININKGFLETYSLPVYLPATGSYTAAQGYYTDSLEAIQKGIQITLGNEKQEVVKSFNFSVNEDYTSYRVGAGKTSIKSLSLMPNLIGSPVSKAEEFCNANNITLSIEYVDYGQLHFNENVATGLIGDQSVSIGTLINNVTSLTIYIPNAYTPVEEPKQEETTAPKKEETKKTEDNNKKEEDKKPSEDEEEIIENVIGED